MNADFDDAGVLLKPERAQTSLKTAGEVPYCMQSRSLLYVIYLYDYKTIAENGKPGRIQQVEGAAQG